MKSPEGLKSKKTTTEAVETSKNPFEVLEPSLQGKTEADLTEEQKAVEEAFRKQSLERFLELIDQEKLYVHGTEVNVAHILKDGLRSVYRLESDGRLPKSTNQHWQEGNNERLRWSLFEPLQQFYKENQREGISKEEYTEAYENLKKKILEQMPPVGRERISHFLNKVFPKFIEKYGHPEEFSKSMYDTGKLLKPKPKDPKELWALLSSIIGGQNLISSTPSAHLKRQIFDRREILGFGDYFLRPMMRGESYDIYFEGPPAIQQYDLAHPRDFAVSLDIGMASRVSPMRFRAIRFGDYDEGTRTFYLRKPNEEGNTMSASDISFIAGLQTAGLLLLDRNLIPLPPLESVSVKEYSAQVNPKLKKKEFRGIRKEDQGYIVRKRVHMATTRRFRK